MRETIRLHGHEVSFLREGSGPALVLVPVGLLAAAPLLPMPPATPDPGCGDWLAFVVPLPVAPGTG